MFSNYKLQKTYKKHEKGKKTLALNLCTTNINDFEDHLLKRTSSWLKLIRITAWLKRVKLDENFKFSLLTANELHYAELILFWLAHSNLRTAEYRTARMKLKLKPSTDEIGFLRIHGRLNNFPYNEAIKNPIALHSKSKITKLYAEHMHRNLGHQDYRVVMVNLRQNGIHIIRGKQLLKSIAAKCNKCRIARRKLMEQQMGQLPPFRLKYHSPPFSSVSIDMFGPIKIKKTRNVTTLGCILFIACNTTGVIHLETAETQSTNDFLLAWRRFVTKRGIHPKHMYSDQGKSFIEAQIPLRK